MHFTAIMQRCNALEPSISPQTLAVSDPTAGAISAGAEPTCIPTAADLLGRVVGARDRGHQRVTSPTRRWHGYRAPGTVTLLTSQWQSGQTTRVALLLARLPQGGRWPACRWPRGRPSSFPKKAAPIDRPGSSTSASATASIGYASRSQPRPPLTSEWR